jgi:phosphatidylglycerol lysyltransferase
MSPTAPSPVDPADDLRSRDARAAIGIVSTVARVVRRAPLTATVVLVLWVVGAATGSLIDGPAATLSLAVGTGVGPLHDGRWWTLLTSALWCWGLPSYLLCTGGLLVLLPIAERRLGGVRAGVALLLLHVIGTLAGIGVIMLLGSGGGRWTTQLDESTALGPSVGLVSIALAASAGFGALWRRRLRLLLLTGLCMMALYSGLLNDVLRLAGGVLGLLVGVVALGRHRHDAQPARPSRTETRVLVALLVAASALGPLIAALAQTHVGPLSVLRFVFASPAPDSLTVQQICADPAAVRECRSLVARVRLTGVAPGLMSIMPVILLLIAAEGLRRGRQVAWAAALLLNLVLGILGLALAAHTAAAALEQRIMLGSGVHVHAWLIIALPALQPLLVAALLVATHRRFDQRAPIGTYRGATRVVAGTFVAVSVVYVGGSLLLTADYDRPPTLQAVLRELPPRFLPPGYLGGSAPAFLPVSEPALWLFEWTGLVFWAVVGTVALASFTRSRIDTEWNLRRVRSLLHSTGGSSLSHMATWQGHSYWFTPDGTAAVAYRVIGGIAITTGDPIGDPAARACAVRGFVAHCTDHAWTPCLYSVDAEVRSIAQTMGWSSVQVAEEIVLPLADLAFTGKKWQDVRTALNNAQKAGFVAEWTSFPTAPLGITDQIRAISAEWAASSGLPEMGFTLGGLAELDDPEVRLLIAVDDDRTVHGATSWLPVRRNGEVVGWTLDFMRRRADGPNGVMEFLIASAALLCKSEGAEFLSLSGAPLARFDRSRPIDGLQRLLDTVGRRLEPVYGFASLLAFKSKFQPQYRPLYMAYPEPVMLPAIGNAIYRAYLPNLSTRQVAQLASAVLRRRPSSVLKKLGRRSSRSL